jgi:hypothetical protein
MTITIGIWVVPAFLTFLWLLLLLGSHDKSDVYGVRGLLLLMLLLPVLATWLMYGLCVLSWQ